MQNDKFYAALIGRDYSAAANIFRENSPADYVTTLIVRNSESRAREAAKNLATLFNGDFSVEAKDPVKDSRYWRLRISSSL